MASWPVRVAGREEAPSMRRFVLVWLAALPLVMPGAFGAPAKQPNVLIIMTDDQGHGDLGVHGNPVIKTPNLDRFAREAVRLSRFYVSPVCSPTRSSLLTGRYNYRTRVVDTFVGRSMMDPDEVTLAERLTEVGYRTGIFGKWHLGDNAPMRAIDQGFQEALVLKGGGMGQPSDPAGGSSYFDPILQHNGQAERRKGYCSDVFTDAAIEFMTGSKQAGRPFFTYLAFNCPHDPLEVPDSYLEAYAKADLSESRFPAEGYPLPGMMPSDQMARVYGMVTNIDDNLGRLFKTLDDLGITRDTLVIFLTDNGPAQARFNSGLRDRKGTVYDGGIRVPFFLRWTGTLPQGLEIDRNAAHIDVVPTVLEACGIAPGASPKLDGVSLWPLVTGRVAPSDWPDRTLFFQWHRGDVPERFRAFAARQQRFKLVRAEGSTAPRPAAFELFDMEADPFERRDVSTEHPEVVQRLKGVYSTWFNDVGRTRGFDPPRIHLGSRLESPSVLTRQDWRGPRAGWGPDALGYWEVFVARPGRYRVAVTLKPAPDACVARFKLGGVKRECAVKAGAMYFVLEPLPLETGPGRLEMWIDHNGRSSGVWSVEVERLD